MTTYNYKYDADSLRERNKRLVADRKRGLTFGQLGVKYKVTKERARQIYMKATTGRRW